jgi:hypothetical protein
MATELSLPFCFNFAAACHRPHRLLLVLVLWCELGAPAAPGPPPRAPSGRVAPPLAHSPAARLGRGPCRVRQSIRSSSERSIRALVNRSIREGGGGLMMAFARLGIVRVERTSARSSIRYFFFLPNHSSKNILLLF